MTNGYGGGVSYTYQPYQADGRGDAGSDFSYARVQTRTVTSGLTNGGTSQPEQHVTTYRYAGKRTLYGGTPGHGQVDVADALGITRHHFHPDHDRQDGDRPGLRGRGTKTEALLTDGTAVNVQQQTWELERLDTGEDDGNRDIKRHVVTLTAAEWWSSDRGGKQVKRTEYEYDQYGNAVQVREHGDTAVSGDERTTVYTYVPNKARWLVQQPATETLHRGVAATPSAGTALVQTRFSYDGQLHGHPPRFGLPTRVERRAAQDPGLSTTTLTHYDVYGQPLRVTQLANPRHGRVTDRTNPVTTTSLRCDLPDLPGDRARLGGASRRDRRPHRNAGAPGGADGNRAQWHVREPARGLVGAAGWRGDHPLRAALPGGQQWRLDCGQCLHWPGDRIRPVGSGRQHRLRGAGAGLERQRRQCLVAQRQGHHGHHHFC